MKTAIMQPYFFPYIGYFQLMQAVDSFVVYDKIQFTKKGWIHRNRFLQNGKDAYFTLPLKKDSDYLDIVERDLADEYLGTNKKTLRKLEAAYRKAPFYKQIFPIVESCFLYSKHENLFDFIFNSLCAVKTLLDIECEVVLFSNLSSETTDLRKLKGEHKVIEMCNVLGTKHYINPIGGQQLYRKEHFVEHNIKLSFLNPDSIEYKQFNNIFCSNLSIIDVLMFNEPSEINMMLNKYDLI